MSHEPSVNRVLRVEVCYLPDEDEWQAFVYDKPHGPPIWFTKRYVTESYARRAALEWLLREKG